VKALPVIISFYTKDSPYQWHAEALQKSCVELGLAYDIQGVDSAGSWEANCAYKPLFILQMLQKYKSGVLWVDADGLIVQKIAPLDVFSSDIAIRVNPECENTHPSKIITSTMYVAYTKVAAELIKDWAGLCLQELTKPDRTEEMWDQQMLSTALRQTVEPLTVGLLPIEYLKIFDHPRDTELCKEPVIVQSQASRIFKKWMNHGREEGEG
jgi:hypothetical protein